tara:strand:+ start:51 stop:1301 length:1251 start_codon:yes stop_codon:yes gene_type:complete
MIRQNSIYIISYLTILIGFFFNEDVLGGSRGDYEYHIKFINLFANDLVIGLNKYGYDGYLARNSPVFYIILGKLSEILTLNQIRLINSFGSIIIAILFYKTLKIQFINLKTNDLKILSCILFLSPTIRSLSIWPYPILWALIFFLLSIYFFLQFKNNDYNSNKLFYLSLLSLIFSSYLNYNFACFAIYYLFKYFEKKGLSIDTIKVLAFCFLLSLPAILFLFFRQEIYVFNGPSGFPVDFADVFNMSNKVLLICSIITVYFFIYFNIQQFLYEPFKFICKFKNVTIFSTIIAILIFFFNYPITENFGGGIIFKLSNKLFNNNLLFYVFSIYSLILICTHLSLKDNIIVICILIFLYNIQYTIYMKYYDPLIYFILFFLLKTKLNEKLFKNKYYLKRIYFFCFLIYFSFLFKSNLIV